MNPQMPVCQEDEVLIGTGDFDAGQWTAYVCGPAVDDYLLPDTAMNQTSDWTGWALILAAIALSSLRRSRAQGSWRPFTSLRRKARRSL